MLYCISASAAPEVGGGIHLVSLDESGRLTPLSSLPCAYPMYTAKDRNTLHILLRDGEGGNSSLISTAITNGTFDVPTPPISTQGEVACHLTAQNGDIYAVNYRSGNMIKIGGRVLAFDRKGPHTRRQEKSHTHQVILSPDSRHVLVTDLGGDTITVLDRDLEIVSEACVPAGNGCRHMIFSPDGRYLYCVNELSATVSIFSWQDGRLIYLNEVSSEVPAQMMEGTTAAAIRLSADGKKLYISNRGEDTLVVFETADGMHFTLTQKISCGGAGPRDFMITKDEKYLLCTNERSNTVTVFAMDDGRIGALTDTLSLPAPLCVMEW